MSYSITPAMSGMCAVTGLVPCGGAKQQALLLGDLENGEIVPITPDTTPEVHIFLPPGWTIGPVSFTNGTDTYGPFTGVVTDGIWVYNVTVPWNLGTYTVVGTPANDGSPQPVLGTLTITGLGILAGPNFGILANGQIGILATTF